MIQGGDPTGTGKGGQSIWGKEFKNETSDKLIPVRGALCMANAGPDTNGSQFFVVQNREVTDEMLDSSPIELTKAQRDLFKEQGGYPSLTGDYTVFGQLYDGYDVLDKIAQTQTVSDAKAENKPKKTLSLKNHRKELLEKPPGGTDAYHRTGSHKKRTVLQADLCLYPG